MYAATYMHTNLACVEIYIYKGDIPWQDAVTMALP